MNDNQSKYKSLHELLELVNEPHKSICEDILAKHGDLMQAAQGSTHNHQAWPGGYLDHIREIMNLAVVFYTPMYSRRPLSFSLSDALFVLFLHDLEKPWAFIEVDGILKRAISKEDSHKFRIMKLAEHGTQLSKELENAIYFVEGENYSYSSNRRMMSPLAAFCHMCDVASARIWFDYPAEQEDSWSGAGRLGQL